VASSTIQRKVNEAHINWGTTLTVTPNGPQAVFIDGSYKMIIVWIPSTTDISVMVIPSNGNIFRKDGQNSVTFGATAEDTQCTVTRNGSSITFTSTTTGSYKAFF
jgi:hypothetical protein